MPEKKLHIVIIPTWQPTPDSTSGIFTREQADALAAAGNKVSIFMYQYISLLSWLKKKLKDEPLSQWLKGKLAPTIAYNFVNFSVTRLSSNPEAAQKKAFLNYAEKQFTEYIRKNGKPDIIHHHEIADFCYITAHLSQTFGIPYVLTEHSPYTPDKIHFNPYETKEERLNMIRNASARIAVSTFYQKIYEGYFAAKFITIPNLVTADFTQSLPASPKPTTPFHFISVGALSQVKRHDILIKAFAGAFKNNKNVNLAIIGSGSLEGNLRSLISELGMQEQIQLVGYKPKEELLLLLDKSHVLVVSSESETFSVAAVEALFRGNPVLTTKCGGPEDFITAENGLTCEVDNIPDMQAKLLEIYQIYPSFNNQQISARAKELYSEDAVVSQLEKLYRSVISPSYQVA
jgi:glycosyltransferase involved in cell wall biosynthesis